jgi:hypothetical protein
MSPLSSDGLPSFSVLKVVLDPFFYWPILHQFNSSGSPLTVLKGDVATFPLSTQLLSHNGGRSRSEERVNDQITGV